MMDEHSEFISPTVEIVSAYVAAHPVSPEELKALIHDVHRALAGAADGTATEPPRKPPAVSAKRSITADYLICLEDGRRFKSLKRHLRSAYGLTPDDYRAKWGLPNDYPMVAPSYAEARSALARKTGLGRVGRNGR